MQCRISPVYLLFPNEVGPAETQEIPSCPVLPHADSRGQWRVRLIPTVPAAFLSERVEARSHPPMLARGLKVASWAALGVVGVNLGRGRDAWITVWEESISIFLEGIGGGKNPLGSRRAGRWSVRV